MMYVANLLRTDYSAVGVAAILMIYLLRKYPILAIIAPCVVLILAYKWIESPTVLCIPILMLYNHKRGVGLKYFFYGFYPVHLAILYFVEYVLYIK